MPAQSQVMQKPARKIAIPDALLVRRQYGKMSENRYSCL